MSSGNVERGQVRAMNKYEPQGSWQGLDFISWHQNAIEGVLNRTMTFGLTF